MLLLKHGEAMEELKAHVRMLISQGCVRDEDHPQLWMSGYMAALWAIMEFIDNGQDRVK